MISENNIELSKKFILKHYSDKIDTVIVLGTGLSKVADIINFGSQIPYSEIPNFKFSTAPSHKGKLLLGKLQNQNIAIMQGRLHLYEGYTAQEVVYPLFVLNKLGAKKLIITNAAGSLSSDLKTGNLALISDHINLTGRNPLIGKNNENFGPRFPSMNDAYHKDFIARAKNISSKNNLNIRRGIYAGLPGPNLETEAECKMLKTMGADLVGMSTVLEVIAANYLGMKVLGVSAITNMSNLFHEQAHAQKDIEKAALKSERKLVILIKNFLKEH